MRLDEILEKYDQQIPEAIRDELYKNDDWSYPTLVDT